MPKYPEEITIKVKALYLSKNNELTEIDRNATKNLQELLEGERTPETDEILTGWMQERRRIGPIGGFNNPNSTQSLTYNEQMERMKGWQTQANTLYETLLKYVQQK
jgi:hypothetical protein